MLLNDAFTSETASGLPVAVAMPFDTSCSALVGSVLIRSIELGETLEQVRHDVGVRLEELRWSRRGSS